MSSAFEIILQTCWVWGVISDLEGEIKISAEIISGAFWWYRLTYVLRLRLIQ